MPGIVNFAVKNWTERVIAVVGPTASGKTALALGLAEFWDTEIISFDSRQFYRELRIGSSPPEFSELARVPHHFVGHLSVAEHWSAGTYAERARKRLEVLMAKHQKVVLVGGSGLYLQGLLYGFDHFPEIPPSYREELNRQWQSRGLAPLLDELAEKDPAYFRQVDRKNPQRVLRALEVIRFSGRPFSSFQKQETPDKLPYTWRLVGPDWPREQLYARINRRSDEMLAAGWLEEARALYPWRQHPALQTVGYKELFAYLEGEIPYQQVVEKVKQNTRRYAKRQVTWFRRMPVDWLNPAKLDRLCAPS